MKQPEQKRKEESGKRKETAQEKMFRGGRSRLHLISSSSTAETANSKTSPRVLVTGAAGFIGSALVNALNEQGISDVFVSDILGEDERWRNMAPLAFRDFVPAKKFLEDVTRSKNHYGKFDMCYHLGACSSTLVRDAAYALENNFAYTRDLCRWALENQTRFVYASSAATYGDGSAGMDDKAADLSVFRPLNLYGYTKQLFDLYAWRGGFLDDIVGLKYFNVFGPNEYHKGDMRSLVCKAHAQILETKGIELFKSYKSEYLDGGQCRDFIYVKDAVAMTLHLAATPSAGGLYNVGAGVSRTWNDLAHALFSAMNLPPRIRYIEMPESIRGQYQYDTCADISKLRSTGYETPITTLEAAIADYAGNYLACGKRLGEK